MEYRLISASEAANRLSRQGTDIHQALTRNPGNTSEADHQDQRQRFESLIQGMGKRHRETSGGLKEDDASESAKSERNKASKNQEGRPPEDSVDEFDNEPGDRLHREILPDDRHNSGKDNGHYLHLSLPDSSQKPPVAQPMVNSGQSPDVRLATDIQLDSIDDLIQGQVQRLLINAKQSAWQPTETVQIQLQEHLIPGTSLRLQMVGQGSWQLVASCQSHEIKDILQKALPQLQTRFRDRRLGDLDILDIEVLAL